MITPSLTPASRRRRSPSRTAGIVMPLVLSLPMSFVVSGVPSFASVGPHVLAVWPSAWTLSWLIAFPALPAVLPLVRRIVGLLVEQP